MNFWKKDKDKDKKSASDQKSGTSSQQTGTSSKRTGAPSKRKRTNRAYWNQILPSIKKKTMKSAKKQSRKLQYLLILKKLGKVKYTDVAYLRAFLTKYGKIRPRRKTRIPIQGQHAVAKAIRKARAYGLFLFTYDVLVKP